MAWACWCQSLGALVQSVLKVPYASAPYANDCEKALESYDFLREEI